MTDITVILAKLKASVTGHPERRRVPWHRLAEAEDLWLLGERYFISDVHRDADASKRKRIGPSVGSTRRARGRRSASPERLPPVAKAELSARIGRVLGC